MFRLAVLESVHLHWEKPTKLTKEKYRLIFITSLVHPLKQKFDINFKLYLYLRDKTIKKKMGRESANKLPQYQYKKKLIILIRW
jgi:hypothetical protein